MDVLKELKMTETLADCTGKKSSNVVTPSPSIRHIELAFSIDSKEADQRAEILLLLTTTPLAKSL